MGCVAAKRGSAAEAYVAADLSTPEDAVALPELEKTELWANLAGKYDVTLESVQENPFFAETGLFGPYTRVLVGEDGTCRLFGEPEAEVETVQLVPREAKTPGGESPTASTKTRESDKRATMTDYILPAEMLKLPTSRVYVDESGTFLSENDALTFRAGSLSLENARGWRVRWTREGFEGEE